MKKALLILVGGRSSIPNVLTVIHQKPEVVVAISSIDSHADFSQLHDIIKKILPSCTIEEMKPVDAFDLDEIKTRCEKALQKHTDAIWVFNVTAATTIMSIAAYEVAKKYQQTCWYLNTNKARIITLAGDKGDESIFGIDVIQYVTAYNRELIQGDLEDHRKQSEENWLPFARKVGKNARYTEILKLVMQEVGKDKQGRPSKKSEKEYTLRNAPQDTYSFLEDAQQAGLISQLTEKTVSNICFRLSYLQDKFLNGAWLEAYVCDEARSLKIFDDCQWNQKIVDGDNKNELDVAMTYKAQLLIAECKTGEEAFSSDTLYQLNAIANMLGNKFVGKILITSLSRQGASKDFEAKRKGLSIVLATAEDLPDIDSILKKQAIDPDYPRI